MDVLENLKKLPKMCASKNPSTGEPILIIRGETGYHPLSNGFDIDRYNARHNIAISQVRAMEYGSCFGWEIPLADPDHLDNNR